MRRSLIVLLVLVALLRPAVSWPTALPQEAQAVVSPTEPIKPGFKTYALFLICNPGWLNPASGNSATHWLYKSFQNFGSAIGDDNLAVWFWRSRAFPDADNVDVKRSARFCKAWHLTPSAGPHLVITSTYPDEKHLSDGLPDQSAVFALGSMADSQISDLLTKLTDQLLLTGKVEKEKDTAPSTAARTDSASPFWVRLLGAVQQNINSFGCAWTFKVDAGAVKADLHSCSTKHG